MTATDSTIMSAEPGITPADPPINNPAVLARRALFGFILTFIVARTVVLPFGKGGIIGGTMLALGRALGETAAVLIIISPEYIIKPRILEAGTQTVSALIAGNFGNATKSQLTALLAAGFVLFVITLAVNSAAAVIIRRSRSGLATEA